MANANINKVVYGNDTLIDLTSDTVTPSDVLNSKSFHDASGTLRTGSADLSKYYSTDDTAETTLADDDYVPFYDTSATGKRKSLWSNIKSVLKTYFDTLYNMTTVQWKDQASASDYSAQQIKYGTTTWNIGGTEYMEQTVTMGTSDTTVTFQRLSYLTNSKEISVYAGRAGGDVSGAQNIFPHKSIFLNQSGNTCTIVFPALPVAVSNVVVRIYVR